MTQPTAPALPTMNGSAPDEPVTVQVSADVAQRALEEALKLASARANAAEREMFLWKHAYLDLSATSNAVITELRRKNLELGEHLASSGDPQSETAEGASPSNDGG